VKANKVNWATQGAFITHRGRVYDHNEDACFIREVHTGEGMLHADTVDFKTNETCIVAVADGIGGNSAGEMASKLVAKSFSDFSPGGQEDLAEHLSAVNRQLYEEGKKDSILSGMGATVVGLCFGGAETFAFNVGDARVYRRQDDYLMQVTKDDSIAQVLVDAGELAMDETRSKNLHQLTQAIGGSVEEKGIDPHTYPLKISNQASFLICSDGLHDMVSLDDMEAIMAKETSPGDRVNGLFQAALKGGGEDNITIIWLDVEHVSLRTELRGKQLKIEMNKDEIFELSFKAESVLLDGQDETPYSVQGTTVLLSETEEQIEFANEHGVSVGDELVFKEKGSAAVKYKVTEIK